MSPKEATKSVDAQFGLLKASQDSLYYIVVTWVSWLKYLHSDYIMGLPKNSKRKLVLYLSS